MKKLLEVKEFEYKLNKEYFNVFLDALKDTSNWKIKKSNTREYNINHILTGYEIFDVVDLYLYEISDSCRLYVNNNETKYHPYSIFLCTDRYFHLLKKGNIFNKQYYQYKKSIKFLENFFSSKLLDKDFDKLESIKCDLHCKMTGVSKEEYKIKRSREKKLKRII